MVCLGNICRSPLAEGILKSKLSDRSFFIDSAGTGNYHIGENPDPRSINVAYKFNIDISGQRARQFKVSDFDSFDRIYVMDDSNLKNVLKLARSQEDKAKVSLILNELHSDSISDVPDPYYGGENGFDIVFQLLDKVCSSIATELTN